MTSPFTFHFEPRSPSQRQAERVFTSSELTFLLGPAGSGKSFCALALALREVHQGRARRVIFTRPLVEAGEKMGFLPGNVEEKVQPFAQVMESLKCKMVFRLPKEVLVFLPLSHMRGMTFEDSVMILSEGQNASYTQLRMWATRIGKNSKGIIEGDLDQSDLVTRGEELEDFVYCLEGRPGIGVVDFMGDVDFRSPVVRTVLKYT